MPAAYLHLRPLYFSGMVVFGFQCGLWHHCSIALPGYFFSSLSNQSDADPYVLLSFPATNAVTK
jgi:hypothetical protein